ncbi:MAG: aspartate kinase, partial [Solirubrobacteraceae bacterium]
MIVAKFGGTSVADAPAIRRLVEIVRSRLADRPVVVVSALARVTDALLALAVLACSGDEAALDAAVAALVERHAATAHGLGAGAEAAVPAIVADAAALRRELAAALGRQLRPAELDALAGRGEVWSSRLVAGAFVQAGVDAPWVDMRTVMLTDNRFGRATPQMQAFTARARDRLRPLVDAGRVPVTQGFIGATSDGTPTTLGRGGSDFTASLLGAALGVQRVEIWTDVSGLMTADPRIVPSARTLRAASYEEAAELATFGARVLHPATALPLVRAGI